MPNPDSFTNESYRQTMAGIISNLQEAYNSLLPDHEVGNVPFASEGKESTYALRKKIEQLEKQITLSSESAILSKGEAKDIELLINELEEQLETENDRIGFKIISKIEDALREIKKVVLKK